jgi:hypothetical protein
MAAVLLVILILIAVGYWFFIRPKVRDAGASLREKRENKRRAP